MITRTSLGPHKTVVILVPSIFFITSLVTDYVFYGVAGSDAFSADPQTFYQATEEGQIAASSNIIFFICLVASLMTYLLSWFYIFDTITQEREMLEGLKDPVASGLDPSARTGTGTGSSGSGTGTDDPATTTTEGGAPVGHVAVPTGGDVSMLLEPGSNASHLYGDIIAEDLDARKSVADRVADKEKATLLKRFFIGVSAYVIASMLSFLLPVFLPTVVDRTILAIQNVILWCFMAALLWTFKMREGNQYLALVEADNADTALVDDDDDDDLNEDHDQRARTMEMGILRTGPTSHLGDNNNTNNRGGDDVEASVPSSKSLPPSSIPPQSTAAVSPPHPTTSSSSPPAVAAAPPPERAFVLEDIDDEEDEDEASDVVPKQPVIKTAHQD